MSSITHIRLLDEGFNRDHPGFQRESLKDFYKARIHFLVDVDLEDYGYSATEHQNHQVMEFHRSDDLLSYLLSKNVCFSIEKPTWVRKKLHGRLKKILENNSP